MYAQRMQHVTHILRKFQNSSCVKNFFKFFLGKYNLKQFKIDQILKVKCLRIKRKIHFCNIVNKICLCVAISIFIVS